MKTFRFVSLGLLLAPTLLRADSALTIYNQDFAVVREAISFELNPGINAVDFAGVTARLEPDSVVLRDPSGRTALRVLEQSYRADAASQGLLLAMHEGKEIDFLVTDDEGKEYPVRGRIVRSGYRGVGDAATPIVEVDGKLRFSLPGQPIFPVLGDEAILKPTLFWQIASEQKTRVDAELGYLTGGMSWQAAYNFVAPEKGDQVDVVGWITLSNHTGRTFENATIKLMAGDVNKVVAQDNYREERLGMVMKAMAAPAAVTEKAFDEFHLYSLPRTTTLRDQEMKQVEFLRATGVKAPALYIFDTAKYGSKIAVVREFENKVENGGLGLPLPKGRTRFYRQDEADGRLEFVGENTIEHTAKNETVRLYTGDVFDLVAERKAIDTQMSNRNDFREEAYEVALRNRKAEPVEVRVVEHLYSGPNWKIVQSSDAYTKSDAQTIEFRVKLAPDEEKKVGYRVRYEWK